MINETDINLEASFKVMHGLHNDMALVPSHSLENESDNFRLPSTRSAVMSNRLLN